MSNPFSVTPATSPTLTPTPAPAATSPTMDALRMIAAQLACVFLYRANPAGIAVAGDSGVDWNGKMQKMWDSATMQLQELMFQNRGGFARANGYSDAPIAVGASVTPGGEPVATRSPYPVPRWNGYQYVWG